MGGRGEYRDGKQKRNGEAKRYRVFLTCCEMRNMVTRNRVMYMQLITLGSFTRPSLFSMRSPELQYRGQGSPGNSTSRGSCHLLLHGPTLQAVMRESYMYGPGRAFVRMCYSVKCVHIHVCLCVCVCVWCVPVSSSIWSP